MAIHGGEMRERVNVMQAKIAENQTIQVRVSEAAAEIDCAELLMDRIIATCQDRAANGPPLDQGDVLRIQRDCAYIAQLCQRAVGRLSAALGAGGLSEDNRVQQAEVDLKGVAAHITMAWDANAAPYGKHLFGLPHHGLI